MGSSASAQQQQSIAKSQLQLKKDAHQMSKSDPERWQELKKRQVKLMDRLELSGALGQPLERVEYIVQYLENKGVFVEAGLLGQGGSGFILKAFNEKEEKLAVKMLKCTTKDQIKENKQEYAVLNQFHSEYVTKVYDQLQFEFDSANYMVILMERCAYDLRKYLQISKSKNKLPGIRELLKMAEQMVQGLIVLHSKNIIHLDIKPANILFGLDKVWKYADLGVSRTLANDKQHISHLNGYTAVYSSPEQYQLMQFNASCKITKKSDIYSLGIVFMELTGAEVEKKWLVQQKTQSKVLTEEALNGEFPEFNERVIIPMVKYSHEDRIELDQLLVVIQDMLEGKVRPVKTNLARQEEDKISLPDQDDPLNFDSHKYKQIQMQYKAEKKHMRNSMGAAPEGLKNDSALKQLMQQQSQQQGQQQLQKRQPSAKNQLIMQSKDQKLSQFPGSNEDSFHLTEGSSLQLENHLSYQPEQQYYLTNNFENKRGISPGLMKKQIYLGSSGNPLQKQYSISNANLPPNPQTSLPVLKLADKNNRPQSDYYLNQSSNNGNNSNNYQRTSSNPPTPQYIPSSKSTNLPSFFSSKSIKFYPEKNAEQQQYDSSGSYQLNNSLSSPNKSMRKTALGQEPSSLGSNAPVGDLPRRSMYGKQVFLQNQIKQQQKSYYDSPDYSRTNTHPDEEDDSRIAQILPQSSQGRQTSYNIPMANRQFDNKQTNEPLHMMKQQSQLAMIAQMQLFQNYQRSGENHNQIANPVLRIFN